VSLGELRPVLLQPVLLQLERRPGALRAQVESALLRHGQPLRWAITAVDQSAEGRSLLQIEAVVMGSIDPQCSEA
jgi:hypothetical protein